MDNPQLTPRQEKYVQNLLQGKSQREAYREAYPSSRKWKDSAVDSQASITLSGTKVSQRYNALKDELKNRNLLTAERIMLEYSRLGTFDPRKLFNDDDSPKRITELDDDTAAAVAGLDVMEIYEGRGEDREFVGHLKKYKLADKKGALDSAAKVLGMFVERHEHTGPGGGPMEIAQLTPEERQARIDDLIKRREGGKT